MLRWSSAAPTTMCCESEVEEIGCGVRFVVNADADEGGQLSSLVAGLREADRPGIRALMVVPVDAPLVTADTIATLIAAFSSTGAPIVRARHQGWNGHPVIFRARVFDELRGADPKVGAKSSPSGTPKWHPQRRCGRRRGRRGRGYARGLPEVVRLLTGGGNERALNPLQRHADLEADLECREIAARHISCRCKACACNCDELMACRRRIGRRRGRSARHDRTM